MSPKLSRKPYQIRQRRYLARLKAALLALFEGMCRECGAKERLEFAHTKPTPLAGTNSRGKQRRLLDIKRHPECYALMCHDCHEVFDGGIPAYEGRQHGRYDQ
jgi:hypothetical protein